MSLRRHIRLEFVSRNPNRFAHIHLIDPSSRDFLHMSGAGTTTNPHYAWKGYQYQAATLRKRALARGDEWNFLPVRASLFARPDVHLRIAQIQSRADLYAQGAT